MVEFPLLRMPTPEVRQLPRGFGGSFRLKFPDRHKQIQRIGPAFQRLQDVMKRDPFILRRDPAGIAPERALVIEIAGSVDKLYEAVVLVKGLSILSEEGWEGDADEDFSVIDTRQGREGKIRHDKPVGGRLYLAMPDLQALQHLVSLWDRYQNDLPFDKGLTPWRNAFKQLRNIRAWGPQDRVPQEMIEYLKDIIADQPRHTNIRLEVELWSYPSVERQKQAFERFREVVHDSGGEIIHNASIPQIAYEAALINLPASAVNSLLQREEVGLVICDDVMLIRPQSTISLPTKASEIVTDIQSVYPLLPEKKAPPIVGVFDGVPVQGHELLDGRLALDDPDNLDDRSVVSERFHGTEMASLILHGDLNLNESSLRRLIYFRPVFYAPGGGRTERLQQNRLLIDTIYRAVLRMKIGDEEGEATAPNVFVINLSLGDESRPFTGLISPLGRLLDYLADKFGILFIVSAGNILSDLQIPNIGSIEWEDTTPEDRELAILKALGQQRSQRTLLSPSEALNIITVGSWYEDAHTNTQEPHTVFPSYTKKGPNITSAIGLGHRKVIKPDIFMPGGREHHIVKRSGNAGLSIGVEPASRFFGLKTATPDRTGRLDQEGFTSGTSAAAALATRAAHRLFDALVDEDNGRLLVDADPFYYGLVIKALLVHRARWSDELGKLLEKTYGPKGRGKHVEHRDNIARVLGYGRPVVEEAMNCASNRATLVGYDEITANEFSHSFRVPLPLSLERVTEPRSVTLTLAWFSPVNVRRQVYRRAKLEIRPDNFKDKVGIERLRLQPSDKSVPRGTIFHVHYEGKKAVQFIDDGDMIFQVFCRAQGGHLEQPIKYGLAVTIEAGEHIPVYQEIRDRLTLQVHTYS